MSSLLVINRVYRLELQLVMVFFTPALGIIAPLTFSQVAQNIEKHGNRCEILDELFRGLFSLAFAYVQFVPRPNLSITTLDLKVVFLLCAQDQDSYIRRRILELLCKNGVQGVKFCLKTTPAAAAGTKTDTAEAALYSSDEAREAATDDDIAEVEDRGAASVPPAVSQSVAVRRLFSGLPQRMENTLCRLKVVCP
jgi:hypothetical protein